MKLFQSHIFALFRPWNQALRCATYLGNQSLANITELSIASKMCIHVPDEEHLGFKNYSSFFKERRPRMNAALIFFKCGT
jgi:hypothetical protein